MDDTRRKDIHGYLKRAAKLSPKQRLGYMGELREFLYNNMTPEGRKFFERMRKERGDSDRS